MISFEEKWAAVDELARKRFVILDDDRRRLESAIEESLYRDLTGGHTCLPEKDVRSSLVKLLGTTALANLAFSQAESSTVYRRVNGFFQAQGPYLSKVTSLNGGVACPPVSKPKGKRPFVPPATHLTRLDGILDTYEQAHAIELTQEQRDAVCTSAGASLMLVTIFAHRHRQQEGTSAFLRYSKPP